MNSTNNPDIQQAVNTLVKAVLPHVTPEQIEAVVAAVFILARVLRKAIPDNVQTGVWGTILKHLALEINPTPAVKPVDAVTSITPPKP